jgi:hypothetical protein
MEEAAGKTNILSASIGAQLRKVSTALVVYLHWSYKLEKCSRPALQQDLPARPQETLWRYFRRWAGEPGQAL